MGKIPPMAMAALAEEISAVVADAPRRLRVGDSRDSREGGEIWFGDNLAVLQTMEAESVGLIYIDPPFNTGKVQSRKQIRVWREGEATAITASKRATVMAAARKCAR